MAHEFISGHREEQRAARGGRILMQLLRVAQLAVADARAEPQPVTWKMPSASR